ncbi:hypothetical protein BP5796_11388 [Coleophoma crateriformis]|uniref:Uncharacterized protein n=1 Tax=Coleophoma crateriformis TaxID=565419 RepID=A0A3D8QI24_9HELO|nr:hypothetical protein BP5796_11388 [Coleophoma crateriformis]
MMNETQPEWENGLMLDLDDDALGESSKFTFVVSTPSYAAHEQREVQRLVRKHVMRPFTKRKRRGKHKGARLAPRASLIVQHNNLMPLDLNDGIDNGMGSPLNPTASITWFGAARVDPFAAYPIQMDHQGHELIDHIWRVARVNFQPFRDFWFPLGLVDAAAMHQILSNTAMHLNALRGRSDDVRAALEYNTAAIKSVNRRLPDASQNTSDGILGAILGFMCHDDKQMDNRYDRWTIHLQGFQKMLALRGGLETIESNRELRLSLFWIEHNIMSDHDRVPQFPPPIRYLSSPYGEITREQSLSHRDSIIARSQLLPLVSRELLDIMTELSALTLLLSSPRTKERNLWLDSNFPGLHIYPTLYKVLAVQKVVHEDDITDIAHETCRLGAHLCLSEIRRRFGVSPVLTDIPVAKLRALLEDEKIKIYAQLGDPLILWVLMMAGCASTGEGRSWAFDALRDLAASRDLRDGGQSMEIVSQMWWIEEVFAPKCEQFQVQFESFERR